MKTPKEVRDGLIETLRLDLVGPRAGSPNHDKYAEETLPTAPSKWYLTGFLVPYDAPPEARSDDTGDDELDQIDRVSPGDDEIPPDQASARKAFFPSSMGLSVLVPKETAQLQINVSWGDYVAVRGTDHDLSRRSDEEGTVWGDWQRVPREAEVVLDLPTDTNSKKNEIPDSMGLDLVVSARSVESGGLVPKGTRSVSV